MLHDKEALRSAVRESRAAAPASEWATGDERRTGALVDALTTLGIRTVAAYASVPAEPSTTALIERWRGAGGRVLLPVLAREISWAWFDGWERTQPAWRGIPHPVGQRLGPDALQKAEAVLVPCLAVGRDGTRLGTGGGWYDRALPHRRPGASVIALARDADLFPSVPVEEHDLPVDAIATESGVIWASRS